MLQKTVPSDDFTALKSAEAKAQQQLLDYVRSINDQHRSSKSGARAGTDAAQMVALTVLAHWLGILESFTPSLPNIPNGGTSHHHDSINELGLLFVDKAALTTGERLRVKHDRIVYVLNLFGLLSENGSTATASLESDILQSLGGLLGMAQGFPATLLAKASPLMRLEDEYESLSLLRAPSGAGARSDGALELNAGRTRTATR
jgi:hypothetical protein